MNNNNNNWIPVSSGNLPMEDEDVQVTYIRCFDAKPYCDEFAYIHQKIWFWTSGGSVDSQTSIIAWKPIGEPYRGD